MAEDNVAKVEGAVPAAPVIVPGSSPAAQVQPPQAPAFDLEALAAKVAEVVQARLQANPDTGWLYGGTPPPAEANDNPFASFTTPTAQPAAPVQPPAGQPAPGAQEPTLAELKAELGKVKDALANFGEQTQQKNAQAVFQSEVGRRIATDATFAALAPEKQRQLFPRLMRIAQTIDIATEAKLDWPDIVRHTFDEAANIATAWNASAIPASQPPPGVPGMPVPPPRAVAGTAVPIPQKVTVKHGEWDAAEMKARNEAYARGEIAAL